MPTLQFMPWCRIDRLYSVGDVVLIPYQRDSAVEGLDELTTLKVRIILSSYRDLEGHPVEQAALVRLRDKPILADLSDDEFELTREFVEIAVFSGLAHRDYFNPIGRYCNTDCFTLYGQRFDDLGFISITSRRREGRTHNGRPLAETVFSIPVHVSALRQVSLEYAFLTAILDFRQNASDEEWPRWQNAISCFNQANTDNDSVRYQVEWVLLASAFEHLLAAKSQAEDVAQKFTDAMVPEVPLLVKDAKRQCDRWRDTTKSLRHEWIKEFYRLRGDFAHGRLKTKQPAVWNPLEHIVLATIVFPLLVLCLLKKKTKYKVGDTEQARIDAFENLADEQFLSRPTDQKNSLDSVWSRLVKEARSKLQRRNLEKNLKAKGLWDEKSNK